MDDGTRASRTAHLYTKIFEVEDQDHGTLIVCIEGEHPIEEEGFNPLPFDFHVFTTRNGVIAHLEDELAAQDAVSYATAVYYVLEADMVTTGAAPVISEDENTASIDVPGHGTVTAQCGGVIEINHEELDDAYELFMANPSPGVYLLIVLEIIGTNPLEYRSIDTENAALCDAIRDAYLEDLGALDEDELDN
jgi:hypothetical protein